MAAKVFFLLALTAAVVCAENDCNCDPKTEMENKDLWNFLSKLSSDPSDPDDKEMRAVLPGVLSPLLECNCLEEKNRRKRRILTKPKETSEELDSTDSEDEDELKGIVHFKTRHCPKGYVWIGIKCVDLEVLNRGPKE